MNYLFLYGEACLPFKYIEILPFPTPRANATEVIEGWVTVILFTISVTSKALLVNLI